MLVFENLTVSYGKRKILDGVSFPLVPCKLTALIGRNGAGKSTLLSCVNQERSYVGKILYENRELAGMSARERARLVALLPQTLAAPPVTVEELVCFGRSPYLDFGKRLTETDRRIVRESMETAGVDGLGAQRVDRLSGGERQKAYFAMMLAQKTPVMALDEPTTYMDMAYERSFFRMLAELKAGGHTLLVVLHDLSQALRQADYLAVLDGGRLAFYGTAAACAETGVIESVFGVEKHTFIENEERFIVFS